MYRVILAARYYAVQSPGNESPKAVPTLQEPSADSDPRFLTEVELIVDAISSSRGLIRRDQILLQVVQDSFLINRQIPRKNDEPDKDTNDLEGQGEITLRRSP
uniref:Uncharacterized protein n=1 Tax=Vespula pensylvanica TaxID=30213 RepID=A0A834P295_VESPE|nr:hypothetical protein H0235_007800 [Vespula pensylvanica]